MAESSLNELFAEWLEKWDELSQIKRPALRVAAPFMSVGIYPLLPSRPHTILLVGKATRNDWSIEEFKQLRKKPTSKRIEERCKATKNFLREAVPERFGGFWGFYHKLGSDKQLKARVIWTNAAKIGVYYPENNSRSVNPQKEFLSEQKELGARTVLAEVAEYSPDLIVCLTARDALDEIVCSAFSSNGAWVEKSLPSGDTVWIQRRSKNHPPILATAHPERKGLAVLKSWVKEAEELLSAR